MKGFRNPPAFLPSPLLRAGQESRQGESISPVICFALPSPFRFLLRDFPQNTFELCLTNTAERNFRTRKVGRSPRRRRGSGQKSPSRSYELGRNGCGEMGGFVTNQGIRSDFLDERLDLVQII